jgi:hypothetical protein
MGLTLILRPFYFLSIVFLDQGFTQSGKTHDKNQPKELKRKKHRQKAGAMRKISL